MNISDGIYAVMLEGLAMDISIPEEGSESKGTMEKVEKAMNAVLAKTPKLRKQHLERMSALAEVSAIQNSALAYLADSQGAVVERDIAHENYQKYQVISQRTELLYILDVGTKTTSLDNSMLLEENITLSNLTINEKGQVDFKMESNLSGALAEKYAENMDIKDLRASIERGDIREHKVAEMERDYLELRENKDKMKEEYIKNLLGIGAKTGAALINPIAGAIVAATVEVLDGNIAEAGKEIIGGAGEAGVIPSNIAEILKGGVDAINVTANVIRESEQMNEEEREKQRGTWAALLGMDYTIMRVKSNNGDGKSETTYTDSQTEIPSYKTQKIVDYLEKNGISEFFEENKDKKNNKDEPLYGTWKNFEDKSEHVEEDKTGSAEYQFLSGKGNLEIQNMDIDVLIEIIKEGLPEEVEYEVSVISEWLNSKGEE